MKRQPDREVKKDRQRYRWRDITNQTSQKDRQVDIDIQADIDRQ